MPQYNVQSMVCSKHHLIAATHVSDQVNDKQHLEPMTALVEEQLDIQVKQVNADSDYCTMSAIEQLEAQGKEVYVAVSEAGQKKVVDQQGQPVTFVYDEQQDQYRCSQGRTLDLLAKGVTKNGQVMNQYRSADCSGCPVREACTTSKVGRTVYRHENAKWREAYKRKMKSTRGKHMLKRRRTSVEHPFGTMRCWMMGPVPILLRGRSKVQTEIQLYQLGYNFKRVYNIASAEVLRYQMENYDWKAAALAMKKADERRKGHKTAQKAA